MELQYPIKSATGELITSLTVNRVKRRDIAAAFKFSENSVEQESFLFARATNLTMEDIDELDMADNTTLSDLFRDMSKGGAKPAEAGRVSAAGAETPAV